MSLQVLGDADFWTEFSIKLSKIVHILRFAMFSSCFSVNPSLRVAHRHGALALREVIQCPELVCKLYNATVLIWKYLKTLVTFFGHPMLATVRNLYLFLSQHWIEVLTIPHSQVVVDNFPNLRAIQFMILPRAGDGNPSNVCPILLCNDSSAVSLVL